MIVDDQYLAHRNCLRLPIPELYWAAATLEEGVELHLRGDVDRAASVFAATNTTTIRDYVELLWGAAKKNPDQVHYLRRRFVEKLPPPLPRAKDRMPNAFQKKAAVSRDGYRCRYCGLWLIPEGVRKVLHRIYPTAVPWGTKNPEQHAAFQALWLQYDHIIPACYGGESTLENLVVSCAGCNFAKFNYHLDQIGLTDPRDRLPIPTRWNGLSQLLERS